MLAIIYLQLTSSSSTDDAAASQRVAMLEKTAETLTERLAEADAEASKNMELQVN